MARHEHARFGQSVRPSGNEPGRPILTRDRRVVRHVATSDRRTIPPAPQGPRAAAVPQPDERDRLAGLFGPIRESMGRPLLLLLRGELLEQFAHRLANRWSRLTAEFCR